MANVQGVTAIIGAFRGVMVKVVKHLMSCIWFNNDVSDTTLNGPLSPRGVYDDYWEGGLKHKLLKSALLTRNSRYFCCGPSEIKTCPAGRKQAVTTTVLSIKIVFLNLS